MFIRSLIGSAALATSAAGLSVAARSQGIEDAPVGSEFVPLDEITVPISGTQRVEGALRAKIVLGVSSGAAGSVTDRLPEYRAAAVSGMIEFSRLHATGLTAVDAERLRADVTTALRAIDPTLGAVLITEVAATRV